MIIGVYYIYYEQEDGIMTFSPILNQSIINLLLI